MDSSRKILEIICNNKNTEITDNSYVTKFFTRKDKLITLKAKVLDEGNKILIK